MHTPLSFDAHAGLAWRPPSRETAVIEDVVSVSFAELNVLAVRFLLLFTGAGARPEPVLPVRYQASSVVDGLGTWRASVLPGAAAHGPFGLLSSAAGDVVVVDDAQLVPDVSSGAHPLFEAQGVLAPQTKAHLTRLRAWRSGRQAIRRAAQALEDANILTPDARYPGFRIADLDALDRADPATLSRLQDADALRLAFLVDASRASVTQVAPQLVQPRPSGHGAAVLPPSDAPAATAFLQALREDVA